MPQLVVLIAGFLFWTVGLSEAAAVLIANILVALIPTVLLGAVSKMFQKGPSGSSLASEAASRQVTSRQAIAPRRVLYGMNRVGGIITFLHTTGTSNEFLHIVITLSGHEVNAISAMYFDGVLVPISGGAATGNFAGFVNVEYNLGNRNQSTFAGLLAAAPTFWTSAHRQRGCAGAYVKLKWDVNKFPNGVPNITFDVQGRQVYDPRGSGIGYSANAALCIADYLNNAQFGLVAQTKYPVTAAMVSQSGMGGFSAANCVDGDVTTQGWHTDTAVAGAWVQVDLGASNAQEFRRCRIFVQAVATTRNYDVQYSDNGSTWTLCSIAYVVNVAGWNEAELAPNGPHRYWRFLLQNTPGSGGYQNEFEFYTSDVDYTQLIAAANTSDEAVSLAAGGTEPRYTINGSFDTSEAPSAVIGRMNSAMSGSCLYVAGKWGIYPGAWRAATISLSDKDLRGPFTVQSRLSHRDLYNGVKGVFISPINNWQITDYPPYQSSAYLQEDNNEPLWLDVELPFTTSVSTVQRLSRIALERARRQKTVQAQFNLTAYQVQPLDVVQFSHPRFGWTNKTFEVTACNLVYAPDSQNAVAIGVDLSLRETDSTVYDWSSTAEVVPVVPAPPTFPQNTVAQPITSLVVTPAEIIRVADGVRTSYIGLTWTAPADQFVLTGGHIVVQYKKNSSGVWIDVGKKDGSITSAEIGPVVDGTLYNIQIWAENSSGVKSAVVTANATPTGTAVTVDTIGDGTSYIRGPIIGGSAVVVENGNFEASASILPPPGWQNYNFTPTLAYETSTQFSGLRSLKVTSTGSGAGGVMSLRKYASRPGDVFRISGMAKLVSGTGPAQIQVTFRDGSGSGINSAFATTASASWTFISGSAIAPAGTVYLTIEVFANSATAVAMFDEIHVARMQTSFEVTPINTSGGAVSPTAVLSQSGTSKTILVASCTIQFGAGSIVYNSGSVTPAAYGTYYVFADDPGFNGGAVTYQASLLESDVYGADGRIFFGSITTLVGGGGTPPVGSRPGAGGGRKAAL